jgi:predicted hydrocarbon binding protein
MIIFMRNLKLKGLKYTRGKFLLFDDRFLFFPPQLIDILSSIYGEGVKSLLVWLGKKMGWTLSQNWEENMKPKTLDDLVNQFCDILSNQGWGLFISKNISDESIIIEHYHNISSELENKSKYFCYFITGIMSGFGEFALYRATVQELSCSIENSSLDCCEYKINKIF